MLKNGCFDPIQKTQTVNARCNTDRHCQFLENTECIPSYQDIGTKTCRCKKGTLPKPAIKDTGLVPGCEETEFTQLLTVDSCRRVFTLGAYTVEYELHSASDQILKDSIRMQKFAREMILFLLRNVFLFFFLSKEIRLFLLRVCHCLRS